MFFYGNDLFCYIVRLLFTEQEFKILILIYYKNLR